MIQTINPATEEVIQNYLLLNNEQINSRIDAGHLAFQAWRKSDFSQRKKLMNRVADLLCKNKKQYASLITSEMGKPITSSEAEIEKCAWVCQYYAEQAEQHLKARFIDTDMKRTKVCYQPLGIVFAIMPWNFPFWQVFRFAAPTLMAGNAAILKHAPISTGTGEAIAELILEAGYPEHLFQHFIVDNEGAAKVIANNNVVAVTLTGSGKAGSSVASTAGKYLKKTVLELGGNDPYLVLEDADLDLAANAIISSRFNNAGQSCIAAKRILAVQSIADELIHKIEQLIMGYQMGDPKDPSTKLGPMARGDLRDALHQQVQKSIELGAKLQRGGVIPKRKGFYYPATLLTGVKPGMPAFDEELFGPVISVTAVEDEAEAIRLANKSQFGLGSAVFTRDIERGERIATEEIQAGSCFVNDFLASDPRLPFGGIKQSGYGRELSREGILEFINVKTVGINESDNAK